MKGFTPFNHRKRHCFVALLIFFSVSCLSLSARVAAESETLYYSSVGAGYLEGRSFRTLFHLMNEGTEPSSGRLQFFSSRGGALGLGVAATWVGPRGTFEVTAGRGTFSIPTKSALELVLLPPPPSLPSAVGWGRLQFQGELAARALLQVAGRRGRLPLQNFEDRIEHEAEILSTPGLKSFSFPIFFFSGSGDVRTAFSIVNLSSVPGTARLTLRPGNTRVITLRPGELVADYFEQFWRVAFPAIFPLRFHGVADVESDVPLAITVFRTAGPFPLSGVAAVARRRTEGVVEASLGSEFTLAVDQTALIPAENLRVTFWDVAEDSRCPVDALCIQQGRATIVLRIAKGDQSLGELRLSTGGGPNTTRMDRYSFTLVRVEPPRRSDQIPDIADYRVTLIVGGARPLEAAAVQIVASPVVSLL